MLATPRTKPGFPNELMTVPHRRSSAKTTRELVPQPWSQGNDCNERTTGTEQVTTQTTSKANLTPQNDAIKTQGTIEVHKNALLQVQEYDDKEQGLE